MTIVVLGHEPTVAFYFKLVSASLGESSTSRMSRRLKKIISPSGKVSIRLIYRKFDDGEPEFLN